MDDEVDYFLEELPSNPQYLELAQDTGQFSLLWV